MSVNTDKIRVGDEVEFRCGGRVKVVGVPYLRSFLFGGASSDITYTYLSDGCYEYSFFNLLDIVAVHPRQLTAEERFEKIAEIAAKEAGPGNMGYASALQEILALAKGVT
jgi:hypothetical protein